MLLAEAKSQYTSGGGKSWVRAQSGQTKDHEIGICCFSTKHSALGVKSKNGWLGVRIMCSSGAICIIYPLQWYDQTALTICKSSCCNKQAFKFWGIPILNVGGVAHANRWTDRQNVLNYQDKQLHSTGTWYFNLKLLHNLTSNVSATSYMQFLDFFTFKIHFPFINAWKLWLLDL
jgi:hypothetical protein